MPRPPITGLRRVLVLLSLGLVLGTPAHGYPPQQHQRLTFLSAREFNRCNVRQEVPPLTALQVRYVVRGAVEEGESFLGRLLRWRYYSPESDGARVLWLLETRLGARFRRATEEFSESEDDAGRYRALGVIVYYLQLMTSPPHVLPVYQPRFWLGELGDAFDRYPIDAEQVDAVLGGWCPSPAAPEQVDFEVLLRATAERTRSALKAPLIDFGVDWSAFWQADARPGNFGSYGPAGNRFGRATRFPCENGQCVLVDDDPVYVDFAAARHADAVRVTVEAITSAQRYATAATTARRRDADARSAP